MKKKFAILLLMIASLTVCAQYNTEDVIYLKDGNIIHGMIIEQVPNVSFKIKSGVNIFVYKIEEIEKITKEEITPERKDNKENDSTLNFENSFSLCVNYVIPSGSSYAEASPQPDPPGYPVVIPPNIGYFQNHGYSIDLCYNREIFKGFGIMGKYVFQSNSLDLDDLNNEFQTATGTRIYFNKLSIGFQGFFRIKDKSTIHVYALFGQQLQSYYTYTITTTYYSNYSSHKTSTAYDYLSYLSSEFNTGCNYSLKLNKSFGIFFNTSYSLIIADEVDAIDVTTSIDNASTLLSAKYFIANFYFGTGISYSLK